MEEKISLTIQMPIHRHSRPIVQTVRLRTITAIRQSDTSSSKITNDEVNKLSDNEFYILNSTSKGITEFYISPTGNNEWGSSLISSTVSSGSKILVSLGSTDLTTRYDIRVVADNGETTEYTGFDMKSTVQITFYDNAQCDVDSI